MKQTDNVAPQSKTRDAIYWIFFTVINGALIWTIWNYKSMPVAYSFDGSWGTFIIRAPWGNAQGRQSVHGANLPDQFTTLSAQPTAAPNKMRLAPPIKVDAQGNPERGSSYRLYRCIVDGYPTFLDSPCDKQPKSPKPVKSDH
jgi:hypothetical protein